MINLCPSSLLSCFTNVTQISNRVSIDANQGTNECIKIDFYTPVGGVKGASTHGIFSKESLHTNQVPPKLLKIKKFRRTSLRKLVNDNILRSINETVNILVTRMHSSRMRTVRCSGRVLWGGGGVHLGSVCKTPPLLWTEWLTGVKTLPCCTRRWVWQGFVYRNGRFFSQKTNLIGRIF